MLSLPYIIVRGETMNKIKKQDIKKIERAIKRNVKNPKMITLLIITLTVATFFYNEIYIQRRETAVVYTVNNKEVRCVDGDTFKMGNETIRLLAIDTPETVKPNTPVQPYGKEASNTTCDLLMNANDITLKQDKGNEVDKYGRTLAWVFIDDIFLQEHLLKLGYAEIKYVQKKTVDKSFLNRLEAAEQQAQDNNIGIWTLK